MIKHKTEKGSNTVVKMWKSIYLGKPRHSVVGGSILTPPDLGQDTEHQVDQCMNEKLL